MPQSLVELIPEQKLELSNHRVFEITRDSSLPLRQRESFLPCVAIVAASFQDVCRYHLKKEPAGHPLQELINHHVAEEANHVDWILADLQTLHVGTTIDYVDACRFIWSEKSKHARSYSYRIVSKTAGATPMMRFVAIAALEATTDVVLRGFAPFYRELSAHKNRELRYFGPVHENAERNHDINQEHLMNKYLSDVVTPETLSDARELLLTIFRYTHLILDEFVECIDDYLVRDWIDTPTDTNLPIQKKTPVPEK